MPELTEITTFRRQAQAFDVLITLLEEPGITEKEACERHSMDPKTFREWIRRDGNALDALRQFIQESQLQSLAEIEIAWPRGLHELVVDFTDPHTKTKDRLQVGKFLRDIKNELEKQYHAEPGIEDEAHAFLKEGPPLKKVKSRMASIEVEPTESGGMQVHVSSYQDVLDITQPPDED